MQVLVLVEFCDLTFQRHITAVMEHDLFGRCAGTRIDVIAGHWIHFAGRPQLLGCLNRFGKRVLEITDIQIAGLVVRDIEIG